MKKTVVLTLMLASLAASTLAVEGDGGYAGAFLQMPLGARPTAMGGAYVGVSDDAAGAIFNPGGLAGMTHREFGSSYRIMTLDRKLGQAAIFLPIQGEAILGLHWIYAASGSVPERDQDGALLGRDFSQTTHQFSILFAKRFEPWLGVGANMSYLYSRLPKISANSVGFDIGGMLFVNELMDREKRDLFFVQDLKIGLVMRNITKQFRWNSEKYMVEYYVGGQGVEVTDKFPIEAALGVSARFLNRKLLVAYDAVKAERQSFKIRAGAEYQVSDQFSLRSGYSIYGFAAGAGFAFHPRPNQTLGIDYAFSTGRADAGSEHLFSIGLKF
ncbi:MAG: PorV/PorQ family protein [candidate division Zixibacteria bacterium]|nr:PorV/PorQ family protein [candidate division Zixibacteria bacterium]